MIMILIFLIELLLELKNKGNTILISEHNYRLFEISDWFIELGLKAVLKEVMLLFKVIKKIKNCSHQ